MRVALADRGGRQRRRGRRGGRPAGLHRPPFRGDRQRAAADRRHRARGGARAAIREAFLHHVIGGKGLSRGRGFVEHGAGANPGRGACAACEVLADVVERRRAGRRRGRRDHRRLLRAAAAGRGRAAWPRTWWRRCGTSRTVEADLGMRWSAEGVVEAAERECPSRLLEPAGVCRARRPRARPPPGRRGRAGTRPRARPPRGPGGGPSPRPSRVAGGESPAPRRRRARHRLRRGAATRGAGGAARPFCGPSRATMPVAGACRGTRGWRRTRHTCSLPWACWRRSTRTPRGRWPCALSVPSPRLGP